MRGFERAHVAPAAAELDTRPSATSSPSLRSLSASPSHEEESPGDSGAAEDDSRSLCVAGLPAGVDEHDLRTFFENVLLLATGGLPGGPAFVTSVAVIQRRATARIRVRSADVAAACLRLNGMEFQGAALRISRPGSGPSGGSDEDAEPSLALDLSKVPFVEGAEAGEASGEGQDGGEAQDGDEGQVGGKGGTRQRSEGEDKGGSGPLPPRDTLYTPALGHAVAVALARWLGREVPACFGSPRGSDPDCPTSFLPPRHGSSQGASPRTAASGNTEASIPDEGSSVASLPRGFSQRGEEDTGGTGPAGAWVVTGDEGQKTAREGREEEEGGGGTDGDKVATVGGEEVTGDEDDEEDHALSSTADMEVMMGIGPELDGLPRCLDVLRHASREEGGVPTVRHARAVLTGHEALEILSTHTEHVQRLYAADCEKVRARRQPSPARRTLTSVPFCARLGS